SSLLPRCDAVVPGPAGGRRGRLAPPLGGDDHGGDLHRVFPRRPLARSALSGAAAPRAGVQSSDAYGSTPLSAARRRRSDRAGPGARAARGAEPMVAGERRGKRVLRRVRARPVAVRKLPRLACCAQLVLRGPLFRLPHASRVLRTRVQFLADWLARALPGHGIRPPRRHRRDPAGLRDRRLDASDPPMRHETRVLLRGGVLAGLLATSAAAHVGSPDVYFEGDAGPYHLMVSIRTPPVIPGVAEVEV